jgi:hypothetical protein
MLGLFGSKRKKATQAAIQATRPYIGMAQQFHGLPTQFWRDPYILGFLGFTIGFCGNMAAGGKLSPADSGHVAIDTYDAISNLNGTEIAMRGASFIQSGDLEYRRGSLDASKVIFYGMGTLRDEASDPLVLEAIHSAKNTGSTLSERDRRAYIAGLMIDLSYMKEVRERLAA